MRKVVLVLFFCIPAFAQTGRGPFGFEAGMKRERIISLVGKDAVKSENGDILTLKTAPKPHSGFEAYSLILSPKTGLVKIVAIGKTIRTNGYGTEIQSEFEDISKALSGTYGPGQKMDFLRSGSIWKEPQEWMTGLRKKERFLACAWKEDLPNDLVIVGLDATALSDEAGYLDITYEFKGFHDYLTEKKEQENKVF
jgi:hypothetical protein